MRKPARRTKARKMDSRLSCRTVRLRNPLSAIRRTAPRGFEPSDQPSDAGTPAFPLGFPSPAADSSECPPESLAAAAPPESPSHHRPHPHTPPSAASAPAPSRSSSPAGPPAPPPTDDNHAHPQAPPPHARKAHLHSPKRALSSLFASLCPSTPTPSPLFSPPPAWDRSPPPPPSPSPAYTPSPEGLAGSGARSPSPEVPETAARRSDRRHMGGAYRATGSRQPAHTGSRGGPCGPPPEVFRFWPWAAAEYTPTGRQVLR
jgi:hypothetical protein